MECGWEVIHSKQSVPCWAVEDRNAGVAPFPFEKDALKSVGTAEIHKIRKVRRSQRLALPTG